MVIRPNACWRMRPIAHALPPAQRRDRNQQIQDRLPASPKTSLSPKVCSAIRRIPRIPRLGLDSLSALQELRTPADRCRRPCGCRAGPIDRNRRRLGNIPPAPLRHGSGARATILMVEPIHGLPLRIPAIPCCFVTHLLMRRPSHRAPQSSRLGHNDAESEANRKQLIFLHSVDVPPGVIAFELIIVRWGAGAGPYRAL
jgi:hypothetical protein